MSKRHSSLRTRIKELALVGVALAFSLLVGEVLLRLLGVSYPVFVRTDPVRGAAHIPGVRGWNTREGRAWVEINSDGLRGPEVAVAKPAGTFRIALLGDSYIEATQVPFEKSVGEVLESRLSKLRGRPVEVLNFGVGGYGSTQQLFTLRDQVWKYSPDLILLAVTTGNDISDNHRSLKKVEYVPYHVFSGGELVVDESFLKSKEYLDRNTWGNRILLPLVQHSRLAQLINDFRYTWRVRKRKEARPGEDLGEPGLNESIFRPPLPGSEWEEAWRVTEGVLRLIRDECRSKHTPLALVTLTTGIQVHPMREGKEKLLRRLGVKDLYYPDRRLAALGKAEEIPVLNLAPTMAKEAEERQVFFHGFDGHLGKGHWNQDGHKFAGELIGTWIAGGLARVPKESRN
jgi:hypothetical protein